MQVWVASAPAEVNGMPGSNNTGRGLGCQFLKNKFMFIKSNNRFLPQVQRQNFTEIILEQLKRKLKNQKNSHFKEYYITCLKGSNSSKTNF